MSALSKTERDGLEDVFLSIHTNENKFYQFKETLTLIISKNKYILKTNLTKHANYGIKKAKSSYLFNYLYKKKKNLSK